MYLAVALIELGQPQRAHDVLLGSEVGEELGTSRSGAVQAYEVLTRAELALGRVDAADGWARRAAAVAREDELAGESALAHRARAAVALARGDAQDAAEIALHAASRAAEAASVVEAGRCRILAAKALAHAGRRADAVRELERGVHELRGAGAHLYRAEAESELRRLRQGPPRTTNATPGDDGLAGLTDREREIAELVRGGQTNRQIAASIFVSEKTVERHLSRAYTKMGVASRTALALLVAGADNGRPER